MWLEIEKGAVKGKVGTFWSAATSQKRKIRKGGLYVI